MIWQCVNFVKDPLYLNQVKSGDSFVMCNFRQLSMNTPLLVGLTGISLIRCNVVNCVFPPDTEIDDQTNTSTNEYAVDKEGNISIVANYTKKTIPKMSQNKYDQILADPTVTNAIVKHILGRQINEAKAKYNGERSNPREGVVI